MFTMRARDKNENESQAISQNAGDCLDFNEEQRSVRPESSEYRLKRFILSAREPVHGRRGIRPLAGQSWASH